MDESETPFIVLGDKMHKWLGTNSRIRAGMAVKPALNASLSPTTFVILYFKSDILMNLHTLESSVEMAVIIRLSSSVLISPMEPERRSMAAWRKSIKKIDLRSIRKVILTPA